MASQSVQFLLIIYSMFIKEFQYPSKSKNIFTSKLHHKIFLNKEVDSTIIQYFLISSWMFTKEIFWNIIYNKRKILLLWCWCQYALLACIMYCKRLMDFFHGSKLCWVANKKFFLPSFFPTTLTNFLWWGILKFTWPLFLAWKFCLL